MSCSPNTSTSVVALFMWRDLVQESICSEPDRFLRRSSTVSSSSESEEDTWAPTSSLSSTAVRKWWRWWGRMTNTRPEEQVGTLARWTGSQLSVSATWGTWWRTSSWTWNCTKMREALTTWFSPGRERTKFHWMSWRARTRWRRSRASRAWVQLLRGRRWILEWAVQRGSPRDTWTERPLMTTSRRESVLPTSEDESLIHQVETSHFLSDKVDYIWNYKLGKLMQALALLYFIILISFLDLRLTSIQDNYKISD